jgi:hypothetical protein
LKEIWLNDLEKECTAAYNYVTNISPDIWLSTEWVTNTSLPPRYGIVNSNMSESTNNMLEQARHVSWLEAIDFIITKMSKRISTLRNKYRTESGVVDHQHSHLETLWKNCSGYTVDQIEENGDEFLVTRTTTKLSEPTKSHTINMTTKTCTCGVWQDYERPCVDVCAYYKLFEEKTFDYMLKHAVSSYYQVETQKKLFKSNFRPVVIDNLQSDGVTKPPIAPKRSAGRPKLTRLQKRNKAKPKIVIKCSKCGSVGHNIRTCDVRSNKSGNELELDVT